MKYPFEKQSDLKDCGVCCLLMLTRFYGGGVSKEYLRNLTNTTKEGVSAYSLIEGAKQLGFSAYGAKGKIENLKSSNLPCIAHVVINKSYPHFIVIYKIDFKKQQLLIADPSKKECTKISIKEFKKISTDQYLFFSPCKKIKYIEKNKILKDFIMKFIGEKYKFCLLILCLSFLITILNIIYSFHFKLLLEYVISYRNRNNLILLGMIFFGIILMKEFSNYFRNHYINTLNHQLDKSLILNVYHHILSLPYLYYKNRTTGEIIARMNDLATIRDVISKLLIAVLLDISLALLVFIVLFFLNQTLTGILFLVTILIFLTMLCFQKPLERKIQKSKEEGAKVNSFLVETIGGIETVKNQNIQTFIENNFLLKYCKYNKNSYSYNQFFILEQFLKEIINQIGILFMMIVGCYFVIDNRMDIATLITMITLSGYLLDPVKDVIDLNLSWKEAKTSFERISELYEIEEEKIRKNDQKTKKELLGKVDIKNLMYSYNGKDFLIKGMNMEILPGSRVLIYGSSGSGKSTLAKILAKQLDINNKMLYYDEKDINQYSLSDIRNQVCYISQQETLFTDSIYQNIVLDKTVDYNDFLDIAKECMIDEFAENNILTYNMLLEENGFNISGGQRQRIILARALLKDAKIYILDESLNEVDIEKERIILENLFKKYPDKTFVVISHRFHNQDLFTQKYYIEEGISYEK